MEDLEQPAEGNNTVGDNYKECHTLQFNNRNKQKEKMLLCPIHNMILWVNYTCMIIMYKGYTHDSWGHFVNPSSQTRKLPPFVQGSLEWALSWPRFLNEKRVKEVLEVWKMTLYRVTGLVGFGVSNLSLNGTSFSFRCSGGIYRSIAPNASHVNTLFSPPCSENFGFDRICLANLSPFLYCLCS